MWAAANDDAAFRRRREHGHRGKRRRTDGGGGIRGENRGDGADKVDGGENLANYDDDHSGVSSDGDRSTTESVDINVPPTCGASKSAPTVATDRMKRNRGSPSSRRRQRDKKRAREETVEAAMARLKSSYSTAMDAVGALHRVSQQYCAVWEREGKNACGGVNAGREVNESQAVDANKVDHQLRGDQNQDGNLSVALRGASADEESGCKRKEAEANGEPLENTETSPVLSNGDSIIVVESQREALSTAQRVARAARTALEQSLLLDHIILAPILLREKKDKKVKKTSINRQNDSHANDSSEEMSSAWLDARNSPPRNGEASATNGQTCRSLDKWDRLGAAHRAVVRQISYLSLVNYADLLLCGCVCNRSKHSSGDDGPVKGEVLDQGAVPILGILRSKADGASSLKAFSENDHHCISLWSEEPAERTIHLALAAYCDASELDPTDPTLWFKLACAARALGWETDCSSPTYAQSTVRANNSSVPPMAYRCLERLALERGMSSLPRGVPPNRLLIRAWREMEGWHQEPSSFVDGISQEGDRNASGEGAVDDHPVSNKIDKPLELVIYLPRYSWATLGRILIRACQEGVSYSPSTLHHIWSTNCLEGDDFFGSPLVDLRIVPFFGIPHCVLGRICEYLQEDLTDIKSLACTCREMPSELATAQTTMIQDKKLVANAPKENNDGSESQLESNENVSNEPSETDTPGTNNSSSVSNRNRRGNSAATVPRRGRVSKRVRSQIISSEKETERLWKRNSVEYNLLAGALSCTSQNPYYAELLKTNCSWEQLPLLKKCLRKLPRLLQAIIKGSGEEADGAFCIDKNVQPACQVDRINAFIAPTSLNAFIIKWSRNNSGPRHFLELFLVHVSLNAGDVFGAEMTTFGLNNQFTSCPQLESTVVDCFDAVRENAGIQTESTAWYGAETYKENGSIELAHQVLAVNLLIAELKLKRCESHDMRSQDQEEDSDAIEFMISNMLQFVSAMTSELEVLDTISLELQCRCYWLASSFYLWIGAFSTDAATSKRAEDIGFEHLNRAILLLSEYEEHTRGSQLFIRTPHLELSDRRGDKHPKSVLSVETLSRYRDHLKSSSTVSRARQIFGDIQSELNERSGPGNDVTVAAAEKEKLASIGVELLSRYKVDDEKTRDSHNELLELLNDFLLFHEEQLFDKMASEQAGANWGRIWEEIPSSHPSSSVAISRAGSRPSIIQVLASSLVAAEKHVSSVWMAFSKITLTAIKAQSLLKGANGYIGSIKHSKHKENTHSGCDSTEDITKKAHVRREHLLMLARIFFIDKMADMITNYSNESDILNAIEHYVQQEDLNNIIFASMNLPPCYQDDQIANSTLQVNSCQSISRLVLALREAGLSRNVQEKVESVYFVTLAKALICQRHDFAKATGPCNDAKQIDKRSKKWQLNLAAKVDLIFICANEIADLLSLNPSTVDSSGNVSLSHLIRAITSSESFDPGALAPLVQLNEALIYLWNMLTDTHDSPTRNLVRNRLAVPISSAIIALCSCPGVSVESAFAQEKSDLAFSDYFDSEASVNGLDDDEQPRRVLLRQFCQLVQCTSLVFNFVRDQKLVLPDSAPTNFPSHQHGPFLPLVVVRVLSSISDGIFTLFSEDNWIESYPFGARECGNTIDNLLGRAYMYLHGFSFSSVCDSDAFEPKPPESIHAAMQLFRCVKRVYHDNRRSPPMKAFETVALALPPAGESKVGLAIREYLFAPREENIGKTDVPPEFPEWVISEAENGSLSGDEHQNTIEKLHRRVCHELAKDPISTFDAGHKSPSDMNDQGLSEEREVATSHEISLDRKFQAVLDDLCYNPNDSRKWIVLSESLIFKAEYICDRLVPQQDSFDSSDFCLNPESKRRSAATMALDEVKAFQSEEYLKSRQNWKPFIGSSLQFYVQFPWSNLTSLQACAKCVGKTISVDDNEHWREIESKRGSSPISWASAWGGLFVMALRTMRVRALLVARYLAKKNRGDMHPSEVDEDLGTALYGDLMASTVYGYPTHPMTRHEKRKIAECSKFYFEEAIDLSVSPKNAHRSQTTPWECQFMIGKCHEKIAGTLKEEAYLLDRDESGSRPPARLYELHMTEAINNYSKAYVDSRKAELSSGGPDKVGGSSHGALECLYRLHASRLKALISAIRRGKEECDLAESEAFRITSIEWFDKSNNQSSTSGIRGKTWDVFADCVDALSHCRREVPLFHRAGYRLAQAYNWAPAFHNPDCDLTLGSKQVVPAFKSFRIRGLGTGAAVESAEIAISKLFEKRRSQLCAVWVTTSTAPPPFEVLNDSVRKYDALRLKYINAYLHTLYVSERRDKIQKFFDLALQCNQDLPSFYEASASLAGGDPGRPWKQSLLLGSGKGFITKVKRTAMSALANLILKSLVIMKKDGVTDKVEMKLAQYFVHAYTLFRRLNSSCKEVAEHIESKKLIEVEAFLKCYLSIQAGCRISSVDIYSIDRETLGTILEAAIPTAKSMIQEAKTSSRKEKSKSTVPNKG